MAVRIDRGEVVGAGVIDEVPTDRLHWWQDNRCGDVLELYECPSELLGAVGRRDQPQQWLRGSQGVQHGIAGRWDECRVPSCGDWVTLKYRAVDGRGERPQIENRASHRFDKGTPVDVSPTLRRKREQYLGDDVVGTLDDGSRYGWKRQGGRGGLKTGCRCSRLTTTTLCRAKLVNQRASSVDRQRLVGADPEQALEFVRIVANAVRTIGCLLDIGLRGQGDVVVQ